MKMKKKLMLAKAKVEHDAETIGTDLTALRRDKVVGCGMAIATTASALSRVVLCGASDGMSKLVGILLQIAFYLGIVVIVIGGIKFALALKDDNPDSQTRSVPIILAGIVLMALDGIVKLIIGDSGGVTISRQDF